MRHVKETPCSAFISFTMRSIAFFAFDSSLPTLEFLYTVPNFSISYRIARFNASFRSLSLRNGPARLSLR